MSGYSFSCQGFDFGIEDFLRHSLSFADLPLLQLNLGPDFSAYITLQLPEMRVILFFISPPSLFLMKA